MRRLLPVLLVLALSACATQQAPSGPTAGPGTPSSTPAPTRTPKPTQGRPAGPTPTLGPSPTARPTPGLPTPDAWTRYQTPPERVCSIRVYDLIFDDFDYAGLHLNAILSRMRDHPEWLADTDFERQAKRVAREMDDLPDNDCSAYGKAMLQAAAADLLTAFEFYQDGQPDWAARALENAQSASVLAFQWKVGSKWWSQVVVPLH